MINVRGHSGSGEACHPSVTLGTAYPQIVVVNLLLSQDAVSHGANSMSSRPSSPPAHFPSPPEEEFTIHMSGAPCSMQAKPWAPTLSNLYRLQRSDRAQWFARCAVSPPRTTSACRISWKECCLMIWQRHSTQVSLPISSHWFLYYLHRVVIMAW